jgi:hypothetical protein
VTEYRDPCHPADPFGDDTMQPPPKRFTRRQQIIVVVVSAGLLALAYYFLLYPFVEHRRWQQDVQYRILCLAERRPDDVDQKQWAACLHLTWNLHANYGPITYFDSRARYPFLTEFDRRLEGKVDLSTIDWIWDQYSQQTQGGKRYSDQYRPTTPERLKEASLDQYGEFNLDGWLAELKRRRAGKK